MSALIQYAFHDGVARIALDSPHNRNAMSLQLLTEFCAAVDRASAEPAIRATVLTGTGPVFCAGADLKEPAENHLARAAQMLALFEKLNALRGPLIIALNGPVRAGGLGLLGMADIVVAPQSATFAFTEVLIGVVAAVISVPILPRMDARAAQRYFLTGETFDSAEAVRNGLITLAVADDAVNARVDGLLQQLRKAAPSAVAATKALLRDRAGKPFTGAALAAAAALSAEIFASDDAAEGMRAFAERRAPRWASD